MSEDLRDLTKFERIKRYRELAQRAAALAADAHSDDTEKSFLMIAAGWQSLADNLEHDVDRP